MDDWQEDRIYSANHGPLIRLHEIDEGLEVTADVLDNELTVVLELDGVTKLRQALQRYERKMKRVMKA